jgi:hypothetical protein
MTPRLDETEAVAAAGGAAVGAGADATGAGVAVDADGAGAGVDAAGGGCCALKEVAPSKAPSTSSTRKRSRPRYAIAPLHGPAEGPPAAVRGMLQRVPGARTALRGSTKAKQPRYVSAREAAKPAGHGRAEGGGSEARAPDLERAVHHPRRHAIVNNVEASFCCKQP